MTESIREYIKGIPSEQLQDCLIEMDQLSVSMKTKHPLHQETDVATLYLVGEVEEVESPEEEMLVKKKVTITAIEFIDWGIIPDREYDESDGEESEWTDEQIQELVAEQVQELLDLEVGNYEHALYLSGIGANAYRAPLKKPIVMLRTGLLLRPIGADDDVKVTIVE